MRLLELFELQQQEGPCLDAFRTGERVGHENLDAGSGRWPSFSAAALQAGFASASAVPLRLRDVTIGALNLLSVTRAPMAEADVIVARAFADLATRQHRPASRQRRGPAPERAALRRPDQPGGDRAGQGRDLRTRRRRPGRRLSPGCGPTPATTTCASPMSPRPPSTAPSTRWPGLPDNDYAVRWWTARAIWLGRPEPVLGDLGRHAIDPAWRRGTAHRPLGAPGGRLCRTGRPVVDTVRSAERRPRDGPVFA